jgi:NAD(P)-dependent dehydrogenase (short-subunit alcohol dehydrogenase family)
MNSVKERRVLVTGANRGIGRELVRVALDRGAACVYAAAREPALVTPHERVVPVRLDVTDPAQIAAAAAHADVDLLVSNAGVACYGPALSDDATALRHALEVNLFGPLALARSFAPAAGIVFVLSVAAVALSRSAPGYSASKAAGLMTALAVREELPGVAVTVALPGFVDTEMSAPLSMPKENPRTVAERILDGWADGVPTVWPDAFAELVRDTVGADFVHLLDRPREVMTAVQAAYRAGTA